MKISFGRTYTALKLNFLFFFSYYYYIFEISVLVSNWWSLSNLRGCFPSYYYEHIKFINPWLSKPLPSLFPLFSI